jgi:hypothetical protein
LEVIGHIIGFVILNCLLVLAGGIVVIILWVLFWGHRRPKMLILLTACWPLLSLYYLTACGICFELFVPNNPDVFFGDFKEPLPHGYVLTGLGKMPDFAFIDSTPPMVHQPPLHGGIRRLELDGEIVYGAYGHLDSDDAFSERDRDHGYFVFDTRTGSVKNLGTIEQLNAAAGHPVRLVESEYFRSQESGRIWLRRVENSIYFVPPILVLLYCLYKLIRFRFRREELTEPRAECTDTLGLRG